MAVSRMSGATVAAEATTATVISSENGGVVPIDDTATQLRSVRARALLLPSQEALQAHGDSTFTDLAEQAAGYVALSVRQQRQPHD